MSSLVKLRKAEAEPGSHEAIMPFNSELLDFVKLASRVVTDIARGNDVAG